MRNKKRSGGGLNRLSASVRIWTKDFGDVDWDPHQPNVLIAFRLQSEFGHYLGLVDSYANMMRGLNRLSASVRIWTDKLCVKHLESVLGAVLIAFRLQSEFGRGKRDGECRK